MTTMSKNRGPRAGQNPQWDQVPRDNRGSRVGVAVRTRWNACRFAARQKPLPAVVAALGGGGRGSTDGVAVAGTGNGDPAWKRRGKQCHFHPLVGQIHAIAQNYLKATFALLLKRSKLRAGLMGAAVAVAEVESLETLMTLVVMLMMMMTTTTMMMMVVMMMMLMVMTTMTMMVMVMMMAVTTTAVMSVEPARCFWGQR